ncbi:hypothetical protein M513_09421 [Trichuris suis]|nr:hypothetical protein M513_09421 [Trichuris suis]
MKQLARRYCWWPGIDKNIEQLAASCTSCQSLAPNPAKQFSRPCWGKSWLVCVDAFSKYPYVVEMKGTSTAATISALDAIFTIEGFPETIVTDNGPQFTSEKFDGFCRKYGIHITSAPYHPASNGLAKRFVRTSRQQSKKGSMMAFV